MTIIWNIHLVIRVALNDAVRKGLVSRNVALVADAPKLKSIPKVEQKAWTSAVAGVSTRSGGASPVPCLVAGDPHRVAPQRTPRPEVG